MQCVKGEDVRVFLTSLCCRRDELATAGVQVSEKEYERTILQGISSELVTFALHLLSLALIVHSTTKIDLDTLINLICEEGDHLRSRSVHGKPSQGGRTSPEAEEAFVATGPRRRPMRCRGKCQRCGEKGHWVCECCTLKKEGNATASSTQALLGATLPPKTQIVGETHTVLEIAEDPWLAEEEVIHVQMVDAELDLTSGHPEDPHEVAHTQVVSTEPDLNWGHPENTVKAAHTQLVSAELDPLLGDRDDLEDKAHAQMVDAELGPTWGYPEDPVVDAHAQFVSAEPDPPLDDPNVDARMHLESMEPEVLKDEGDDLQLEVEEVEEVETAKEIADIDKEHVDLQGLRISHLNAQGGEYPYLPIIPIK